MARFLVVKDNIGCLELNNNPFIEGATGNKALDKVLPINMIGVIKRVRAWEEPDFVLQKLVGKVHRETNGGYIVGYKYHHPTISKEQNNA